jgi:hypothetical protein
MPSKVSRQSVGLKGVTTSPPHPQQHLCMAVRYRHIKFPKLAMKEGDEIPKGSSYWRIPKTRISPSELSEVVSGQCLASEWGKRLPDLYEQILHQQMGSSLVLLWPETAEEDDESDPDENRTAKQRLAERLSRYS